MNQAVMSNLSRCKLWQKDQWHPCFFLPNVGCHTAVARWVKFWRGYSDQRSALLDFDTMQPWNEVTLQVTGCLVTSKVDEFFQKGTLIVQRMSCRDAEMYSTNWRTHPASITAWQLMPWFSKCQEFAAWCDRLQLPNASVPELFEDLDARREQKLGPWHFEMCLGKSRRIEENMQTRVDDGAL